MLQRGWRKVNHINAIAFVDGVLVQRKFMPKLSMANSHSRQTPCGFIVLYDTGASLVDEAPRKGPARRFNASGGQILPCAGEIIDVYPGSFACACFGQIANVFAIDVVRAKGQRLHLEYEALLRFQPRGLGAKRCI